MSDSNIYASGEYLRKNPTWHAEDSAWKARHIVRMIERHALHPSTVVEVGCGVGEILHELSGTLDSTISLDGYEISADAFELAVNRRQNRVNFHLADFTQESVYADLLLAIDVFEHVDDYLGFLRKLQSKGRHHIFHIPLDLSVMTIARKSSLDRCRSVVGHLHYFTKETALATLHEAGYEVVDYFYTAGAVELEGGGMKRALARVPRKLLAKASAPIAARVLGGFSLLVLATGDQDMPTAQTSSA